MNTRLQYWTRTIRIGLKSNTYNTKKCPITYVTGHFIFIDK